MDIFQPYPEEEPELSCAPELLLRRDFSELLRSELLEAPSLFQTTPVLLPHFPSPALKALLQTLKSCSPEPQRLQLSPACSKRSCCCCDTGWGWLQPPAFLFQPRLAPRLGHPADQTQAGMWPGWDLTGSAWQSQGCCLAFISPSGKLTASFPALAPSFPPDLFILGAPAVLFVQV